MMNHLLPGKRTLLAGGAALVLGTAALSVASAQSTPTPSSTGTPGTTRQQSRQQAEDRFLTALAGRLGVTVDRLKQAIQETRTEVAPNGAGPRNGFPPFGQWGPGRGFGMGRESQTAATYLGMTTDELRTQLRQGKSLAQIAQDKGKTADGLIQALVADANQRIDKAQADGKLTAERAAQMKQRVQDAVRNLVNRTAPQRPGSMRGTSA